MKYLTACADYLLVFFVASFFGSLNLFPLAWRLVILTKLAQLVLFLSKKQRHYVLTNLKIAYPDQEASWYQAMLTQACRSLARLLVDFGRLHQIDGKWIEEHVEFPDLERLKQLKAANNGQGLILATGHLGSFELLGHVFVHYFPPTGIVVRPFTLPKINFWWNERRSAWGRIKVIDRSGAFRGTVRSIRKGYSTGILFDQHVRLGHAVYVDFFGQPAATTKMVALVALKTGAPIVTVGFRYKGSDKYQVFTDLCQIDDIVADSALDKEAKIKAITARVCASYEGLVRQYPEGWFWLHRRWRTLPTGERNPRYNVG